MQLQKSARSLLSALGLSVVALPAMAANTAIITATPLRLVLSDLAPDDGITPHLSWLSRRSSVALSIYPSPYPLTSSDTGTALPGTVSMSAGGLSGTWSPQGGQARIVLPSSDAAGYQVYVSEHSQFTLTPHTRVDFYVDAEAWVALEPLHAESLYRFRASTLLLQGGHDGSGWSIGADMIFGNVPTASGSYTLSWSAKNTTADTLSLSANPHLIVVLDGSPITPVPEPAALTQAAAGLAALAVAARLPRRRRQEHDTRG